MHFSGIVTIGSMLVGVIIFIIVLHNEKKKRFILQEEVQSLKKSIEHDETKKDIELRIKEIKNLAGNIIEDINDNTEEKLNTLSNNKIIQFEEYANQVLEKIDINHKEVMFLYDMLNDKIESVNKVIKQLEEAKNNTISKDSSVEDINVAKNDDFEESFVELLNCCDKNEEFNQEIDYKRLEDEQIDYFNYDYPQYSDEIEENVEEISLATVLSEQREEKEEKKEIIVDTKTKSKWNNYQMRNEQIIKLYSLGYSTVDISKKLGIGTGEVALVNNLYHDKFAVAK